MKSSIQHDYGGFKSSFPGIEIRFQDIQSWFLFRKCSNLDSKKELIKNERDIDKKFTILSYSSVYIHEYKHFIDSLVSPFSNTLFRLVLERSLKAQTLVSSVLSETRIIGLPLHKYLLDYDDSIQILSNKISSSQNFKNWKYAFIFPDKIKELAELIGHDNQSIKALSYCDWSHIQPFHLFEATAVLAQHNDVLSDFGTKECSFFLKYLLNACDNYSSALSLLWNNGIVDYWDLNLISNWCILGNIELDGFGATPNNRLNRLLSLPASSLTSKGNECIKKKFNEWNAHLGYSSLEESLDAAKVSNRAHLGEMLNIIQPSDNYVQTILQIVNNRNNLSLSLLDQFIESPENFVLPHRFRTKFNGIHVPVMFNFNNGAVMDSTFASRLLDLHVHESASNSSDGNGLINIKRATLKQHETLDYIFPSLDATDLSDFIEKFEFFVEEDRNTVYFEFYEAALKMHGIHGEEIDILTAF